MEQELIGGEYLQIKIAQCRTKSCRHKSGCINKKISILKQKYICEEFPVPEDSKYYRPLESCSIPKTDMSDILDIFRGSQLFKGERFLLGSQCVPELPCDLGCVLWVGGEDKRTGVAMCHSSLTKEKLSAIRETVVEYNHLRRLADEERRSGRR